MNILKSVTLIMVFLLNLAPAAGQVNPFERVTISAAKSGAESSRQYGNTPERGCRTDQ